MLRVTRGEPRCTCATSKVAGRHVEEYKPWLAARPGQNKPQVTPATIVHRLGTLRMFFLRIDEWGWPEALARVPTRGGDLPRLDHPLPKVLDDAAAAKLLRAAQNDKRLLVRVNAATEDGRVPVHGVETAERIGWVRSSGPDAEIVAIADQAQIAAIAVDNRPEGASMAGSTRDQLTQNAWRRPVQRRPGSDPLPGRRWHRTGPCTGPSASREPRPPEALMPFRRRVAVRRARIRTSVRGPGSTTFPDSMRRRASQKRRFSRACYSAAGRCSSAQRVICSSAGSSARPASVSS